MSKFITMEPVVSSLDQHIEENTKQHCAIARNIVKLRKQIYIQTKQLESEVECRTANNELIFNKLDYHNLWLWILSGISLFEFILIILLMILK